MTVPATRARAKAARSKAVVSRSRNSSRPMTVILKAKVSTAAGSISSGWTRPAAPTASRVAEKKATARARPKAAPSTPLVPDAHQARARATGAAAAVASVAPRAMRPSSVIRSRPPGRSFPTQDRPAAGRGTAPAWKWTENLPGTPGSAPKRRRGCWPPLQPPGGAADTQRVRPRLIALALAVLLTACGGAARPAATPPRDQLVGPTDVERLLVSTQRRKSPNLEVGAATCPDQVRPGQRDQVHLYGPDRGHQGPLRGHPPRRRRGQGHRPLHPGPGQADHRRLPDRRPDPRQAPAHRPGRHRPLRHGQGPGRRGRRLIACNITLGDAVQ